MGLTKLKIASTPYTYVLEWTKLGKRYIGARWAAGCHPSDLWNSYFTSSEYVAEFVKEHGAPDVILIDQTFDNATDAMSREGALLKLYGAVKSEAFLNKNAFGFFDYSDPEINKKRSEALKGKKKTAQQRALLSIAKIGNKNRLGTKTSPQGRLNIGLSKLGSKASEETKAKMSNAHKGKKHAIVTCPHCGTSGGLTGMKSWHFNNCKLKLGE